LHWREKGLEGSEQPNAVGDMGSGKSLHGMGEGGLGLGAKCFFAAVIIAACVAFVKTRKEQMAGYR
jgi:hypothetical protein